MSVSQCYQTLGEAPSSASTEPVRAASYEAAPSNDNDCSPNIDISLEQRRHIVLDHSVPPLLTHHSEDADLVLAVARMREIGFSVCGHFVVVSSLWRVVM